MINCLIVEDEPLAQKVIENYINKTPQLQLASKCSNALQAFELLHAQPVDVIFLDIKMPGINGMDFLRSLKQPPAVIFTTAYAEYAAQSYEVEAVDYLLKPVTYERFVKSIDKLLKKAMPVAEEQKPAHLYIKENGKLIKLLHADILYIEAMKDYLKVVTTQKAYITHMTMKAMLALLPPGQFLRVHRSYIVSVERVVSAGANSVLLADKNIPVGERYKKDYVQFCNKKISPH